jgi:Gametolysin peptidase M11
VVNSVSEIHRALFDSGVSVKTQYESCSIDQFTFVSEGVHELYLPKAIDSYTSALDARNAAYVEIQKSPTYQQSYGNTDVAEVAHNVMFCMPPSEYTGQKVALCKVATDTCRSSGNGSAACREAQDKCNNWKPKGFIANAQSGGSLSTFSDKWCADLSTVVHELGHNLGRGHAGKDGNAYGDSSSNMGGGGNMASPTGPKKCFNSAQHIEFGWYNDHILNFNPNVDAGKMIKLASFVDVRKAGAATEEPVIVKIGKYSLQYNQAKDYNSGAGLANRVTIATDMDSAGVNWVQADLSPESPQYTFSESGKTVYVNYCAAVTGSSNTPDAVYVGIGIGRSACTTIPTGPSPTPPAPAPAPTPRPTPMPNALPTPLPTLWPTPRPIPPTPRPVVGDLPETPDNVPDGDEGDEDEDGLVACLYNPVTRVRFTLDDTPGGTVELARCRNVISQFGSSVCSFTALRRRNNAAWPDKRQIKDICQTECALAGNGMCDPGGDEDSSNDNAAPLPICENEPKRVVRYYDDSQGDNDKSRCAFVNADICMKDSLSKEYEPTGYKVYELCQHQCADQAQCEAI